MMMEDKMLKEKERSNTGWTSAADFQTDTLANYPAVCGASIAPGNFQLYQEQQKRWAVTMGVEAAFEATRR